MKRRRQSKPQRQPGTKKRMETMTAAQAIAKMEQQALKQTTNAPTKKVAVKPTNKRRDRRSTLSQQPDKQTDVDDILNEPLSEQQIAEEITKIKQIADPIQRHIRASNFLDSLKRNPADLSFLTEKKLNQIITSPPKPKVTIAPAKTSPVSDASTQLDQSDQQRDNFKTMREVIKSAGEKAYRSYKSIKRTHKVKRACDNLLTDKHTTAGSVRCFRALNTDNLTTKETGIFAKCNNCLSKNKPCCTVTPAYHITYGTCIKDKNKQSRWISATKDMRAALVWAATDGTDRSSDTRRTTDYRYYGSGTTLEFVLKRHKCYLNKLMDCKLIDITESKYADKIHSTGSVRSAGAKGCGFASQEILIRDYVPKTSYIAEYESRIVGLSNSSLGYDETMLYNALPDTWTSRQNGKYICFQKAHHVVALSMKKDDKPVSRVTKHAIFTKVWSTRMTSRRKIDWYKALVDGINFRGKTAATRTFKKADGLIKKYFTETET